VSKLIVDGVEIDTSVWIDAHIARFTDKTEIWACRRQKLLKEIADYEQVLANFVVAVPRDAPGEAHTKAYIAALKQTHVALLKEFQEPPLS
jgi:hypothetical protein